ncbi:MAG TPA: prephenate dehydrogenase/arogenate dehydrogenase family protein [Burkholderiales bacterium]|jgi:3-hydroxyisobutyrate dehydrogenase-like beta-hydroxyacid dehydrogenase
MERIAFIGFGEAGQTIGRGLLGANAAQIRVYDILGEALEKAAALGARAAKDHVDAVREADIVFLAVTASSSLQAALSCVPGLRKGQLFLDINSVSPQRKIETAARVAPTGALYVDVAVMAPVAPYLHKVPCLIGGPGAEALLPRSRAMGMKMDFVSGEVGQASAIKMFRSIMIKGLEALVLESMLAASEYRVEERVLASLKETFPTLDWEKLSGYMLERVVSHGKRRAAEMREVAETLKAIGIEPLMAGATAARQQWVADLQVKEQLGARKTEDRAELVHAIRRALARK